MNIVKKIAACGVLVTSLAVAGAPAHAGGFLADTFIRPFSPQAADAADATNAALGNPVDHGIAQGMNVVAPGSGSALEGAWALQRSGILNQGNGFAAARPIASGVPLPSPGFGGFGQVGMQLGSRCAVPGGISPPGPVNPVGSFCIWVLPNGMAAQGTVVP